MFIDVINLIDHINEHFAVSWQTMSPDAAARIAGVRQFNRFYTCQIGLLRDGLLGTPFSLTEGRVLYEIAQRGTTTAAELATDLDIDPGYLSRLLRDFMASGIVAR